MPPANNRPSIGPVAATDVTARVVGCGRAHRADDQVGLHVAQLLAADPPPGVTVASSEAPGIDLVLGLEELDLLVVVDAARSGPSLPPGEIVRRTFGRCTLRDWLARQPVMSAGSGHLMSVVEALRLASELEALPAQVWLYGIAGASFEYHPELSPAVGRAAGEAARVIRNDLTRWMTELPHA